ncbi:MAG: hypothetical protein H6657_02465 [Ardenticatenaceae bacterium]|nr:hypothetical protein [Ardenticatenaceae bacterium]
MSKSLMGANCRSDQCADRLFCKTDTSLNPSWEPTAVLTLLLSILFIVASLFQPLMGTNGRSDLCGLLVTRR